jgi:sugar phosphate isomerase/epimerase
MNKLSVRAHDLGRLPANRLIEEAKSLGFEGIQLVFGKALTETVDLTDNQTIPSVLTTFPIDVLGGYFNMVHRDETVVREGIQSFEALLRLQKKIGGLRRQRDRKFDGIALGIPPRESYGSDV